MVEKDTISINDKRIRDYLTPYHYQKPVLSGSGKAGRFDEKAVDIPFVFFMKVNTIWYIQDLTE